MAGKKENLPLIIDQDENTTSTVSYANDVLAVIAGVAANEVDGIAGMCGGINFGKNKNITKGVKIEMGSEEIAIDIYLIVQYGTPIQKAAFNVQENVRKTVEAMTGLHVVRVDVHVQGVSFEKEEKNSVAPSLDEEVLPKSNGPIQFEGEPTPAEEHEDLAIEVDTSFEKHAVYEPQANKEAVQTAAEDISDEAAETVPEAAVEER